MDDVKRLVKGVPVEKMQHLFASVLDSVIKLDANRIRFEQDDDAMHARLYRDRKVLGTIDVPPTWFEGIWVWLAISDPNSSPEGNDGRWSTLNCRVSAGDREVTFTAKRSVMLRGKQSLLIEGMKWLELGAGSQEEPEEKPAPKKIDPDQDILLTLDSGEEVILEVAQQGRSSSDNTSSASKKSRILIVEDNADQRRLLVMSLRTGGYDVSAAEDGVKALEYLKTQVPDLIITDLMMPNMNGGDLLKVLKSHSRLKSVPVIIFTVISDPSVEYDLLDMGADDYFEKTMNKKVLLKRIARILGH